MDTEVLVYIAAVAWDDVAGTDRMLVTALAKSVPVLWVDPPVSVVRAAKRRDPRGDFGVTSVGPAISRLRILVPPGPARAVVRDLVSAYSSWRIAAAVRAMSAKVNAVVVASAEATFPPKLSGPRVFFVTDDWIGGASLMGISPLRVARRMARNLSDADVTAAVTDDLAGKIQALDGSFVDVKLLPNGCTPQDARAMSAAERPADLPPGPLVGLIGQINERIDVKLVAAVADAGITTVVIGPRTERSGSASQALDTVLAHPNVHWLGRKDSQALPAYLAALNVGITPYVDSPFNRASFPLKTLEYLAAGLPVVATDLPAVRWLDSEHILIADSPADFARITTNLATSPPDAARTAARIEFARQHSWAARAQSLLELIAEAARRTSPAR